jgi:hypothetical protein
MLSVLVADGGRAGAQDISRSVWELLPSLDHADELLFLSTKIPKKCPFHNVAVFLECMVHTNNIADISLASVRNLEELIVHEEE